MMKQISDIRRLILVMCVLCVGMIAFTSCDDSDDYGVKLPIYTDVVMTSNGQVVDPSSVPLGQRINLTLQQKRKAQNIYEFEYSWTCTPDVEGMQAQVRTNNNEDVSNGFTANTAGSYILSVRVAYKFAGNDAPKEPETGDNSLIDVAYSLGGDLYGYATITKRFTVK